MAAAMAAMAVWKAVAVMAPAVRAAAALVAARAVTVWVAVVSAAVRVGG